MHLLGGDPDHVVGQVFKAFVRIAQAEIAI